MYIEEAQIIKEGTLSINSQDEDHSVDSWISTLICSLYSSIIVKTHA